jgi:membrane protease YdiL (CAAX protease family)
VPNSSSDTGAHIWQDPALPASESTPATAVPIWPLFVSGILFGLAHAEYGPSWFPLILMGLLLGYLYRCTHRIWACWIVHISLNAISMIGFGLQILSGNPLSMLWQWLGN